MILFNFFASKVFKAEKLASYMLHVTNYDHPLALTLYNALPPRLS